LTTSLDVKTLNAIILFVEFVFQYNKQYIVSYWKAKLIMIVQLLP